MVVDVNLLSVVVDTLVDSVVGVLMEVEVFVVAAAVAVAVVVIDVVVVKGSVLPCNNIYYLK